MIHTIPSSIALRRFLLATAVACLLAGCGGGGGGSLTGDAATGGGGAATANSFIDPTASVQGTVDLGEQVYVAPFAALSGTIRIGDGSDIQDGSVLTGRVTLGGDAIVAHGATIIGPASVGDASGHAAFVGFLALVEGADIEGGAMVLHLARVGPGIVVHSGFKVLPGKNVATQAQADNPVLGKVAPITAGDLAFMEGVLEVNHAFASGYPALERRSPTAVHGIGINPGTFFNPTETLPVVGGVRASRPSFRNRIIGPVTLDDPLSTLEALMGDSISLRADEGYPFHIGRLAAMGDSVTFHALEHTDIEVGDGCSFGTGSLVHGGSDAGNAPRERTQIGDAVAVGDGSIVFRSTLGHDCVIGSRALVDGSQLAPGTVVPSGTILIDNVSQGQIEW